ncbi:PP2C family protein-serine/threonine phosphatase [Nocardioides sp. W7]|uniref:PP2C family protein-serine/threonine phosphatase n=1 Tax=Nocardioides sp. W7 TaxID=2931390 RepID=UPI001FD16CD9|nr:PP2C family protein-serine/threonine phosphatase [Nocardioides sp. W7]
MSLNDGERASTRLLQDALLAGDYQLPDLFEEYGLALGVAPVVVYLADLQQRVLNPFLSSNGAGLDHHVESLAVDSTLAGRAYQHVEMITQQLVEGDSRWRVWLPLIDGMERLGLVSVTVSSPGSLEADGGALRERLQLFSAVAAGLVTAKSLYGDTIVRLRRTGEMGLAAEMQWSMLPPLSFGNPRVTISGGLEPAYTVGGDTFDYAVDSHAVQVAIVDGMGHGLPSAQLTALALAAYRNARRSRLSLTRTVRLLDAAIAAAFDSEAFLTGLIAELDTDSGGFRWINAGHPSPLLLRDGRLVKELHVEPALPIGFGDLLGETGMQLGAEPLQPGDMVLFYTDGVVDARSPAGEFFGADRLVEVVTRHLATGLPAPETMRRVIRSLMQHQGGQLDDDASLLLVQYRPTDLPAHLPGAVTRRKQTSGR